MINQRRFLGILLLLAVTAMACAEGTRAEILEKNATSWTLDKGSAQGVKVGMTGYFWTHVGAGSKRYPFNIARFEVMDVSQSTCRVKATAISSGYSEKDFQWAVFSTRLVPAPKPMPKPIKRGMVIPSGKSVIWYLEQGNGFFRKGDYANARRCYAKILEVDPEDPVAPEKIEECERNILLSKAEKKYGGYVSRGDLLLEKKEIKYALKYYLSAFRALPAKEAEVARKFKAVAASHASEWHEFMSQERAKLAPLLEKYFSAADPPGSKTAQTESVDSIETDPSPTAGNTLSEPGSGQTVDAADNAEPLRVSTVEAPKLVKSVAPRYPAVALRARIRGRVIVEAETDIHGNVTTARVVSGHPLLNQAALDAVKQWVYEPYLIDGVPKPVRFTVVVSFNLQ